MDSLSIKVSLLRSFYGGKNISHYNIKNSDSTYQILQFVTDIFLYMCIFNKRCSIMIDTSLQV